jgi:hypothetical protein
VTHGEPLSQKAAGPQGTGPQEPAPVIPPGVIQYETKDVTPASVARALVILVVSTAVVVAVLFPMFLWLRSRAERADPPPPPMGRMDPGRQPAEPRLQTTPVQDLAAVRLADHELLTSYGWVDEANGVVHIPIDSAMQIIAQRGLPSAAPAPAASPGASPAAGGPPSPAAPSPAAPGVHP